MRQSVHLQDKKERYGYCDVNLNDTDPYIDDWETWQCVALENETWLVFNPASGRGRNLDALRLNEKWEDWALPDSRGPQPRRAVSAMLRRRCGTFTG